MTPPVLVLMNVLQMSVHVAPLVATVVTVPTPDKYRLHLKIVMVTILKLVTLSKHTWQIGRHLLEEDPDVKKSAHLNLLGADLLLCMPCTVERWLLSDISCSTT